MVPALPMAMDRSWVAVCCGDDESVTCTVKLKVPAACGVPEMVPELLIFRPSGRFPELTDQVSGAVPPAAASVVE